MKRLNILRREIKKFIDAASEKMLIKVHAILEAGQETDWWDDLSEEAKASINEGLKDMKAGRLTPHEVVMKKYRK